MTRSSNGRRKKTLRPFYCQVINTSKRGQGQHWLQATALMLRKGVRIKILEPYDEQNAQGLSGHVRREFSRHFPGQNFRFEFTGFQESDDHSHCGHISTWNDLTYRLALVQGCDLLQWQPDPPPDLWFQVIREVLLIHDLQAHLDLAAVDFAAIGAAPLFLSLIHI